MNTLFKLFLLKVNKYKEGGFTLIELLVVIIIIGILAAIALPSFFSQTSKARSVVAKTNVSAIGRAQQVFRAEYGRFANSIPELNPTLKTSDEYYNYAIENNATQGYSKVSGKGTDPSDTSVAMKIFPVTNGQGTTEFKTVMCSQIGEVPDVTNVFDETDCPTPPTN